MSEPARLVVSLKDMASVQLLAISLRMLLDEMRIEANPKAEKLEAIMYRFEAGMSDGGEDDE